MKKTIILFITLLTINAYGQAPPEFLYIPTNISGTNITWENNNKKPKINYYIFQINYIQIKFKTKKLKN